MASAGSLGFRRVAALDEAAGWRLMNNRASLRRREDIVLELYHSPISTCSQKVRLVLAEKDLP